MEREMVIKLDERMGMILLEMLEDQLEIVQCQVKAAEKRLPEMEEWREELAKKELVLSGVIFQLEY